MDAVTIPRRPVSLSSRTPTTHHVWYAAYGSNMHFDRLNYYLAGGRPPGGSRTYPGCRDQRPPRKMIPVVLAGQIYFALESLAWTGGMAFYDPLDPGETPGRAYLVSGSQFADVVAQEMHQSPGGDLDLTEVIRSGRAVLGEGRYETLVCPGLLDGYPVLTFTAPWRSSEAVLNRPSAAYLRNLGSGLRESHGWNADRAAEYLAGRPGALGNWKSAAIAALLGGDSPGIPDNDS